MTNLIARQTIYAMVLFALIVPTSASGQSEDDDWIFNDADVNAADNEQQIDAAEGIEDSAASEWEFPEEPYYEYKEPEAAVPSPQPQVSASPQVQDENQEPLPLVLDDPPAKKTASRIFGRYRVHLGAMRPDFSQVDGYSDHYGRPTVAPTLAAEYYFIEYFLALGMRMQASLYSDRGKASSSQAEWQVDNSQVTTFSIVPLQLALVAQFPILPRRWLVGSGWYGLERIALQEVRQVSGGESDTEVFVNRATKKATVVGLGLSVRISPLGGGRSTGFVSAISYNAIYLTPYFEIVSAEANGIDLSDRRLGLMFSFEIR